MEKKATELIVGQQDLLKNIDRVIEIWSKSGGMIRPHFILTGPSGCGKTFIVSQLAQKYEAKFLEINAAQITKEGMSGNSLSKALSPILQMGADPMVVVFVDEFDKLFISGNCNTQLAHESTSGVQNEFLKVMESETASVYGDYGKYYNATVKKCLFVFAGAFNNQLNMNMDDLRNVGVKTEFLGRAGIVFNCRELSLEELNTILENSTLLTWYCKLFGNMDRNIPIRTIKEYLAKTYKNNTLGARTINTLIHQYFIKEGKLGEGEVEKVTFQTHLDFRTGKSVGFNPSEAFLGMASMPIEDDVF